MAVIHVIRTRFPLCLGFPLAAAGVLSASATHAAVLAGRLPHTAVSGGRVSDPREGRRIAAASLCAMVPVAALVARGAGVGGGATAAERIALGALATAMLASVPVQAGGTRFERRWMAPVAAVGALGMGRLAVGN